MITHADASPEGEGGGEQGGCEQGGGRGGETDGDTEETETTDETELNGGTTPEPTPELDGTPEPTPSPQELVEICDNGQDDDNDGKIDANDSECDQTTSAVLGLTPVPTPTALLTFSPTPTPAPLRPALQGLFETTPSPTPTGTPSPMPSPVLKNINNNQVTVTNDRFTVQDRTGAVTSTPDCSAQDKTISLGPSPMQNGGVRLLAAFDPCILTDGTVALNLPDDQGIELVAANLQGDQTSQSVVVPMQKMSPITQGQSLYIIDLAEQITGFDPASGNPVTMNGNINALFLRNSGGQDVELNADNSVALNAVLKR